MTHCLIPRRATLGAIAGVLTTLLMSAALPIPSAAQTVALADTPVMPPEVRSGSVTYRSGGDDHDQADLMKSHMRDYPLAIELVEKPKTGSRDWYTADARVVITQQDGRKVLDAKAQGPFMLVRLDPGTYQIVATLDNRTLHKKHVVVLNGQTAQATFIFPAGTD